MQTAVLAGLCFQTNGAVPQDRASAPGSASPAPAPTKGYLIDFGLEMQGGVNLTFHNAKAGQKVTVKLSEELLPNGMIKVPMRTTNDFVSRAIVAGFWVAFFQECQQ